MRILHILDHSIPLHSDYSLRTRAILEQQRALGWETFQITSAKHKKSDVLVEEVEGFRFFRTPQPQSWHSRLPLFNQFAIVDGLATRLGEVIEEIKPDILHAHSPALNGLAALRVAQWYSLPVVYECLAFWEDAAVGRGTGREGGLRYKATQALETYIFKRAHAITTICEGLRRDIVHRGIPERKVTVIPNAVDTQRLQFNYGPDPITRAQFGLEGKVVLGFKGHFYAYEDLPLLIEAIPTILQRHSELRLLLIGSGPQESALRQLVKELNLSEVVIFVDGMSHDDIQRYCSQVDIFVFPRCSVRLTELVTPLEPLEALALGRLVIASDVGGHKEIITDGENGVLFKAGSTQDLVNKLLYLLAHPESWPAIKEAGHEFVRSECNWLTNVTRYRDVYMPLLQIESDISLGGSNVRRKSG
jgi:PEP-CTERM/exosortase A-associated glycosyltransferase